ncbi:hypothetical protein FBU30_009997 [Linnemannia zychae]|nr:hypothetical protein FBU30_009997 [Linnemannia zychae]
MTDHGYDNPRVKKPYPQIASSNETTVSDFKDISHKSISLQQQQQSPSSVSAQVESSEKSTKQKNKKTKKNKKEASISTLTLRPEDEIAMSVTSSCMDTNGQQDKDMVILSQNNNLQPLVGIKSTSLRAMAEKKVLETIMEEAIEETGMEAVTVTDVSTKKEGLKVLSEVHSVNKCDDVEIRGQATLSTSTYRDFSSDFYDVKDRQSLHSTIVSEKDHLGFFYDFSMDTKSSSWADDIEEYEQKCGSIAISTDTAQDITRIHESMEEDRATGDITYVEPTSTQSCLIHSQDMQFPSMPSADRLSHFYRDQVYQPFNGPPNLALCDHPKQTFGPMQQQLSSKHHQYQQPAAVYQPGYPPCLPVNGLPMRIYQHSMANYPLYQHQPIYSVHPSEHSSHFGRPIYLRQSCFLESNAQHRSCQQDGRQHRQHRQQQRLHHQQHQLTPSDADSILDPTLAQSSWKQNYYDNDTSPQSPAELRHLPTKLNSPRTLSTKSAWMPRYGNQKTPESLGKSKIEKSENASNTASTDRRHHDKRNMTRQTSPQVPSSSPAQSKSQKHRSKKKEKRMLMFHAQAQNRAQSGHCFQTENQGLALFQDQSQAQYLPWLAQEKPLFHSQSLIEIDMAESPWKNNSRAKSGSEPWEDRNKVAEFFSKRWVEARMSTGGQGPDSTIVYHSTL